jgi:hypothetical protein
MHSTPAHKQTDPAKQAGQIVNPVGMPDNYDMLDDQSLYTMMNRKPRDKTLGDYVRRKSDVEPTSATSAEEKQAVLDGQAFCSRVFDGCPSEQWKPARDVPQGWDHV